MADNKEKTIEEIKVKPKSGKVTAEKEISKKKPATTKKVATKKSTTASKTAIAKKNTENKETTVSKSTTKKATSKNTTKSKTTSASAKSKSNTKTTSSKDTKKIDKSKETKTAQKQDSRIKQIIAEQLENVEKIEEIKEIPIKAKKNKKVEQKIDEKKISQEIEQAKKMPKDEKRNIYKNMFTNILLGTFITLYFVGLGFGFLNVEGKSYVTDLKVFSIVMLAITIILFEYSYNKDSGKFALIGIEMLFVSIITLVLLYIYILYQDKFLLITCIATCVATIYYLIKSISIYIRDKADWKKTRSDVKEIVSEK